MSKLQDVLDKLPESDRIVIEGELTRLHNDIEELELQLDLMSVRPKRRRKHFDDE